MAWNDKPKRDLTNPKLDLFNPYNVIFAREKLSLPTFLTA